MATIDDKVVAMSFESSKFSSGVDNAINSLDKLKNAMKFPDAGKGLDSLQSAASRVDLSNISDGVSNIEGKFSAMSVAGLAIFANLAVAAASAGANVVKAFALDPVLQGFQEYATNLNAIQTTLANTKAAGTTLDDVNVALNDLNTYSDKTIYNFSQMAKNIGTFTAAGVGLGEATQSIKGIANLAAVSGSSADQASVAMYQLSQAIASGTVKLQDWNSVVNAGMGGQVFQKALFDTAKAMGTLKDVPVGQTFEEWKKAGNSFRDSLSGLHKAATDGSAAIAQAQKDGAKAISDAQSAAADATEQAAQRVKDAHQGVADAATKSAADVKAAAAKITDAQKAVADATKKASEDVKMAVQGVKDAQKGVADANKQATKDITDAVQAEHDAVKNSALDVQNALEGVTEARKRLAEAMKPPSTDELQAATDALTTAQLDQQDLAGAVADAQQEQTRSAQDLAAAQKKLADAQSSGASPEEILSATRAVEDAQKRVTDAADAQERALLKQNAAARGVDSAEQALQKTREKGTKTDQNVKDAQDGLTAALNAYHDAQIKASKDIADAEQNVKDVKVRSAEAQKKAEQDLTKAEQNLKDVRIQSAQDVIKAQDAVTKSEQNLRDTRVKSANDQEKAGQQLAQAEKDQAKTIEDAEQRVADAHTNAAEQINKAKNSISGGAPKSWLTSDVLTKTLSQFTGDLTDAQLAAQGFSKDQIKAIQAQARTAQDAATKVKTISQLFSTAQEAVGSGWTQTFQIIIGNFDEARSTLTHFSTELGTVISNSAKARNALLTDWKKLGGRADLIKAIDNIFGDLGATLKPIRDAFHDIFPPVTGKQLAALTKQFEHLTEVLKPSPETVDNLRRTFRGLFAIVDIGKTAIADIFGVFGKLFGIVGLGQGHFLAFTATIGDFLVKVDKAVKQGGLLKGLFGGLAGVLAHPLDILHKIAQAIGDLFGGFDKKSSGGVSDAADTLSAALKPLGEILDRVETAWAKFMDSFDGADKVLGPVFDAIGKMFASIGPAIQDAFAHMNFEGILAVIRTGLFATLVVMFKRFLGNGSLINQITQSGFSNIFGGLTNTLKSFQQQVKAKTLMEIAIAIGVLAAAIVALSFIDPKKLNNALSGLAIAFGELLGAMAILDKIGNSGGFIKMPVIAAAMILFAGAVDILVIAVKQMADLSWNDLLKGLGGVAVLLAGLALVAKPLSTNSAGMIVAGTGMLIIAAALVVLADAVKKFGGMDLKVLAKGLGSVAVALVVIGDSAKLFPPNMPFIGAGLVLIGEGLRLIATAVQQFGKTNLGQLEKGLAAVAVALIAIAGGMELMPPSMPLIAAGLLLVSVSLGQMAQAIGTMGAMSMTQLIKGLLGLGGALTVLAAALFEMQGSVAGAAALTLAAAGLALLAPALTLMGKQSWDTIIKGLIGLGGALALLGIAGVAIAPVAPALLALGGALLAIGAGLALAGAGISLVGIGLSAIATSGAAAIGILMTAISQFLDAVPKMAVDFALGLLSVVKALADVAPKVVDALGAILTSLVQLVIINAPKLATAFEAMLGAVLQVINDKAPDLIAAGFNLLLNLLKGIADNIVQVTNRVGDIVISFLTALATKFPQIVAAGFSLLMQLLGGLLSHAEKIAETAATIVTNFLAGIAAKVTDIVKAGADIIINVLAGIAAKAPDLIAAGLNVVLAILKGIGDKAADVISGAEKLAAKFIHAFVNAVVDLADDVATGIIDLLNGLADVIQNREWEIIGAMANIGKALVMGLVQGLEDNVDLVYKWLKHLVMKIVNSVTDPLGIFSPSKVFADIGQNMMIGMAVGIKNTADQPVTETSKMVSNVNAAMDGLDDDVKSPVITPVVDLTQVQAGKKALDDMWKPGTGTIQVNPPSMMNQAQLASTAFSGYRSSASDYTQGHADSSSSVSNSVYYTQINNSPEALSDVEIYRQTQNQLSQVKSALTPTPR